MQSRFQTFSRPPFYMMAKVVKKNRSSSPTEEEEEGGGERGGEREVGRRYERKKGRGRLTLHDTNAPPPPNASPDPYIISIRIFS